MRTNVDLDDALVEEAFRLTTAKTKKELLHQALEALIQAKKRKNLLDLAGKVQLADDYDYKALRQTRHADN
ncbi:MAG: type II toxin-antitoxin system VapB family antitoxin [Leptolyngbya sp. LCM1.Bin17]|nr:MAG: type II toxin-antitoxin system VapB family antitoxin [Leptolyngbya sp. LCM1.Bin17]